jgi:long-chain fatty acid transport protein
VNDWLSVGAGLSVYYAMLKNEMAVFQGANNPDGSFKVTATDWRVGYNLGILLEPRKGTRVGVAYRSQSEFNLEGKGKTTDMTSAAISGHPTLEVNLPIARSIMVSGYHEFTPKWAGLVDVGWQNWSALHHQTMHFPKATTEINYDWKDTYRLGLGVHYRPMERLLLKTGFSYDSDPTSLASRLPMLPASQQWRYATGFDWDWSKNIVLSLYYEFVDLGRARIDKGIDRVFPDGNVYTVKELEGDYNQFLNVIGLSFRWKFGKGEADSKKEKTAVLA